MRYRFLKKTLLAALVMAVFFLTTAAKADDTSEQRVNPDLLALQATQIPTLRKIGSRVFATEFIGYSNHGFIEGDDGIIVIDGGWFPTTTSQAVKELRRFTDKPVVAIIYTHLHLDHFGGMGPIMAGQASDVPVYAPSGWQHWVTRLLRSDRESILRRVYLQMGMMLPHSEDGTVGNGIGPSPIPEANDPLSFPPTIDVDSPLSIEIAGVPLEIMPMEGDVPEHLWVWLPEDRVLFSGDAPPHGVFPAVETARFEIGRNPDAMLEGVEKSIALAPVAIVPGHSRILVGNEEITRIMSDTYDAISFLIDQVNRFFLSNRSVDDMLDTLQLPPNIAANSELQPYYHRWEWMARQRYIKLGGFIDDSMDYLSLNELEESRRLVPLLGGPERTLGIAENTLLGDPRWAARLATYVLQADPSNIEAREVRQRAFRKVAQTTNSTNERNYLLGLILEEQGTIDFPRQLAKMNSLAYQKLSNAVLLERLKARLIAESADHINLELGLEVDSEPFVLAVRNNVLHVTPASTEQANQAFMSRDELISVVAYLAPLAGLPGWQDDTAQAVAALIE